MSDGGERLTLSIFPGGTPVDNESRRNYIIAAVVVAVILVVGYVLYTHSAPSTPVPGPGQTIAHPFGNANPPQRPNTVNSMTGNPAAQYQTQHRVPGPNPGGAAPAAPPGR